MTTPGERLATERADVERRLASLVRRRDAILEGSQLTTDDDEHDPEGSTIAFERAQVAGLIADARRELEELDTAESRLAAGRYGHCEGCGQVIGAERLDALPAARLCIDCA
ncbi:dksa/trar family transcriptional regulator [Rhodococcus triatomae]|uniref:RNA polymerase-binding transcription factor DksA n=1 Tax=Rhodococcus triatomae TaxID=300028 RepID=A0A1G8L180_9NOCA|nr:TraR/DksA C4-type zinc finger protein [Rhodococcus triatomae]QNG20483.1 dksa/trar family transcriptional regulator [Rhodococcus triatomae]QNG23599.1 dksa/trar family transcriptional regulator [Rhodococcus triatomae]SDI49455.1 RNA polymerase-binding transcription factor DksA [Rhodococcus triatomae]